MKINLPQRADFLLVRISLHLHPFPTSHPIVIRAPPMPTEWIISTLPQWTHYTQLLLAIHVFRYLYRFSRSYAPSCVLLHTQILSLSSHTPHPLSFFSQLHARLGWVAEYDEWNDIIIFAETPFILKTRSLWNIFALY
jgi:hypothetical protein